VSDARYHRNEIIRTLVDGGWEDDEIRESLKAVLDHHAHELAEKIRLHKDEARGAVQATKVVAFCADLIDPEVE